MIFTYKYISHEIEKLQAYLDFLFNDVWIFAEGTFNFSKLDKNPELKDICERLEIQDSELGNFFNSRIAWIYDEFAKIDDDDFKLELIDFYHNNNDIESLCKDKSINPVTYSELKEKYPDLEKALNSFYSRLYGNKSPFNLKIFGKLNKNIIPSHYQKFVKVNDDNICPFCGIYPIDGIYVSTREAYDHFLPKAIYPFSSINFKNLAPMCNKCNSGNKSTCDPIEHIKGRKLAFYPFGDNHPEIEIQFTLLNNNVKSLKPSDFNISINSPSHSEQIDSWKRIFKIHTKYNNDGSIKYYGRYDELICTKHKAKEWYEDIYDYYENATCIEDTIDAEKYYDKVIRATTRNNRLIENTIKREFLKECKLKGLFNVSQTQNTTSSSN
ncbi:hypothetical protein EG240_11730 [Paenimyroides tangerinum]|uniref:HNH endonuclease n=1 Tax=Paenimyroides tangerinum TaxID=2488728 RepID=A0A3P3W2S9_9FLAO|nr:hypothetical protein [Paenimyroides tangerinum]RRJ89411.1 hypothetical protein EG240_11730 [Paenimyroides tangerinum]